MKKYKLVLLIVVILLASSSSSLLSYETHTGTYTFQQLMDGVLVWIRSETPEQTEFNYPFRTHPWMTLRAIQLFEKTYGKTLSDEQKQEIIYGSIEEDSDVEGTAPDGSIYSNLKMSDLAVKVQDDKMLSINVNRCENHFMNYGDDNHGLTDTFLDLDDSDQRKSAAAWALNEGILNTANWSNAVIKAKAKEIEGWRYLGHVLHLLEDMASPAHVRNDSRVILKDDTETRIRDLTIKKHYDLIPDLGEALTADWNWNFFANLSAYTRDNFFSDGTVFKSDPPTSIDKDHKLPVADVCDSDDEYFYSKDDSDNKHKVAYKGLFYTFYYNLYTNKLGYSDSDAEDAAKVLCTIDDKVAEDTFSLAGKKAIQYAAGLIKRFYDASYIPSPGEIITVASHTLVWIPAGSFMMGSEDNEYRHAEYTTPVHKVTLSGFYIGAYEVTQAQYEAVMGENPSFYQGTIYPDHENNPVEQVSWYDAREFCEKLSEQTGWRFTLPSEAQWEYACRAGTTTLYSWGDSDSLIGDYAWWWDNSNGIGGPYGTHPVGTKPHNPWGLYEMHGNVWEWCLDGWHSNYMGAPTDGSAWGEDGRCRIFRGGSYNIDHVDSFRSAFRNTTDEPENKYGDIGFRVLTVWRPSIE